MHYQRWKNHGDALYEPIIFGDDERRFWSYVDRDGPQPFSWTLAFERGILSPCWLWTGQLDKDGYGKMKLKGKTIRVHWYSLELAGIERIPELMPDHLCQMRACQNPEHIEQVTNQENQRRGRAATGRMCARGRHEMIPDNTMVNPQNGGRMCRQCRQDSTRAYLKRLRIASSVGVGASDCGPL